MALRKPRRPYNLAVTALSIVVSRDTTAPSVPANLAAFAVSGSEIDLTWSPSTDTGGSGLKGYNLYRASVLLVAQLTAPSYKDMGLQSGTQYSYTVTALDNVGNESAQSAIAVATTRDTIAPSVPGNLAAVVVSSSQINLSWSPSTDTGGSGLKGYNVYRNGAFLVFVATAAYNNTGLSQGTSYTYSVTAVDNAANESAQSNVVLATTSGGSGTSDATDWLKRSTMPGVVWAHNFDTAAEVNQFRAVGGANIQPNSPSSSVQWNGSDGFAGGGCLEIKVPTGGTSGDVWWRPMSAIAAANNGKTIPDPASNGVLPVNAYDSSVPSVNYNWRKGYYANPAIQSAFPTWPTSTSGVYDGTEFYLQFRVRIQATRWTQGNPAGKLLYIDVTGLTGVQEILVRSIGNPDSVTGQHFVATNPFQFYTSQGSEPNSICTSIQGSYGGSWEPGGPFAATCQVGNLGTPGACWEFPSDQWTTLLFHVIPGRNNDSYYGSHLSDPVANWPFHDTTIEVWKCDLNEIAYTKIFEKFDLAWDFQSGGQTGNVGPDGNWHPAAFNSVNPSAYMNNVVAVAGWYQRYTQMIFSREWIPPPGQSGASWWTA